MSDYLGRLIARRAESICDVIRPRVPALFEPNDMASQPPLAESTSFEHGRPAPSSTRIAHPDEARRWSHTGEGPAPSSNIPLLHRDAQSDKAVEDPPTLYRGNLDDRAQANDLSSRQRNAMSEPAFRNVDRPHDTNSNIPTMPNDLPAFRITPSLESMSPDIKPPSVLAAPQNDRTVAPIVRVTIGRIDVRAIMPTEPTRRPLKASTPKLSLDDYLNRRGTRRT